VVSRAQLQALGLGRDAVRRRVQSKRLLPLYPGVYAVGHDALTPDARRLAAVLACGPGALLSHRAAGAAQHLLSSSPQFDVTVLHARRKPGIATLVDLADVLSEERLAKAVHEAEVQRVFDLRAVEAVVDRLPGRKGRHKLSRVLAAYRPEPHFLRSEAERRFKRLCEDHSLPQPQFNVNIAGQQVDAWWEDIQVAVEIDGAEAHHTRRAFHADRARDRRLAARAIRLVRVTSRDLDDDVRLAAELRAIRVAAALAAGSPPVPACA
jgi:very-short-patch-repair endonuclease